MALMRNALWAVALASLLFPAVAGAEDIDSEHVFGVTEGTDIGAKGDKELEFEFNGRFGKRGGKYGVFSHDAALKMTLTDQFRVAPMVFFDYFNIHRVPGFEDRDQASFSGFAVEMKYRPFDRRQNPFGLTFAATPYWSRVDEISGVSANKYGGQFTVMADKELVEGRLFGAINLRYDAAGSHAHGTGEWTSTSGLGISGALSARVAAGFFVAGEVRHERAYDGLLLRQLSGHSIFVGPAFYTMLSKEVWVAGTWSAQIAGRARDNTGTLDLVNFERHQVKIRLGVGF
jgi:hypothetical protein